MVWRLIQNLPGILPSGEPGYDIHFDDAPTFWGYLSGVLLIPVLAGLWAWTEPTRWAGTQVALGALAVAIMEWRLLQLWEGTGA